MYLIVVAYLRENHYFSSLLERKMRGLVPVPKAFPDSQSLKSILDDVDDSLEFLSTLPMVRLPKDQVPTVNQSIRPHCASVLNLHIVAYFARKKLLSKTPPYDRS